MQDDITPPQPNINKPDEIEPPLDTVSPEPDAFATPIPEASVEPATAPPQLSTMPQPDTAASVQPIGNDSSSPFIPGEQSAAGKKKMFIIGGIIAAVLVIIGGGGAAAYTLWYQNPDKVLGDALVNAMSAKSIIYTSNLDIKLKQSSPAAPSSLTLSLDGKGSYENGSQLDVKLQTTIDKKDVTLSGSGILDKDQNLYFKVNDVKKTLNDVGYGAAMPPEYASVISEVDGKWIKISADDMKTTDKELSKAQTCISDAIKKLQEDKSETKELLDLYKKNPFIVVKDKLGSKDGSLGYAIDIDKDKSKSFGEGFKDTTIYKELDKCDTSKSGDVDSDFTPTSDDVSDTSGAKFEVWVSRFGHQLTNFKTTFEPTDTTSGVTGGEFVFTPEFNKPVDVSAPTDTIALSKVLKDYQAAQTKYMKRVYGKYYSQIQQYSSQNEVALPLGSYDKNVLTLPSL